MRNAERGESINHDEHEIHEANGKRTEEVLGRKICREASMSTKNRKPSFAKATAGRKDWFVVY